MSGRDAGVHKDEYFEPTATWVRNDARESDPKPTIAWAWWKIWATERHNKLTSRSQKKQELEVKSRKGVSEEAGKDVLCALLPKLSASVREGGERKDAEGPEGGEGEAGKEDVELEVELGLDEDVDMCGWLSLRGLMDGPCPLPPNLLLSSSSSSHTAGAAEKNGDESEKDKDNGAARRMVGLREELMRIADLLRDARRVVGLEGSPLVLYGGQVVVKDVEAAKPAAGVVPPAPVFTHQPAVARSATAYPQVAVDAHQQHALASIRARALRDDLDLDDLDLDDDAMTEQTSVTDDDILHDAFSFLNRTGSESKAAEASDEDEIVWDLRHAVSQPKQPITTGTQVPSTTALDLLNTFAKKPVAVLTPPAGGAGAVGMGVGTPDGMLFGSRAALQSIWSASRDERGLMFAGGGGASDGGGGQQQQQQLAHQHAHPPQYEGFRSLRGCRDMLSLGTGTRMGRTTASHCKTSHRRRARPSGRRPTLPRVSTRYHPLASGTLRPRTSPTHQRVVSNAMAAAQLFPSGGDQYGYGPLSAPPPQYMGGVFYATSGQGFAAQSQGYKRMDMVRRRGMDTGSMRDTYRSIRAQLPSIQLMSQLLGNMG
ncbi:hypothetical protein DFH08DRAFT_804298 [Mycena albidolilacea]|uniref:Uncharacterized protein n=1 Tax=Mycena albidolilacea TaxID=1033008 RepID=A0AAD7ABL9_9AGAR|nr:hypothetical protein DFH08DRAFT_804298 [Mycena albidolilacea]